jgi:16S rRNA (guanine(966)-N(2))-methyltransferase RsmD
MRVVAGKYRGRKLKAVPGTLTRPTTDKVKEAVFNILGGQLQGNVLDLYAGSGSLGIEAVSRGARGAVLVDHQYQAIKTIHENVEATKDQAFFEVFKADAFRILPVLKKKGYSFDYVFLDPPYKKQQITKLLHEFALLKLCRLHALIICETDQTADLPQQISDYDLWKRSDYGITEISIYRFRGATQ